MQFSDSSAHLRQHADCGWLDCVGQNEIDRQQVKKRFAAIANNNGKHVHNEEWMDGWWRWCVCVWVFVLQPQRLWFTVYTKVASLFHLSSCVAYNTTQQHIALAPLFCFRVPSVDASAIHSPVSHTAMRSLIAPLLALAPHQTHRRGNTLFLVAIKE